MPILSNPFDAPEAVRARETQEDAWAMYIVVRREAVADQRSLCEATARAVIAAMGARSRPDLAGRYEEWLSGSFRKICLRANEADWRKLAERESIIFFDGPEATSIVAVLPPLRKSDRSGFLRSLQAYNLSAAELPFAACNRAVRAPDAPMGWPSATAPPFTLTRSQSQPSSRPSASACTANASFASIRS